MRTRDDVATSLLQGTLHSMKKCVTLVLLCCVAVLQAGALKTYTDFNTGENFSNPERGFYHDEETYVRKHPAEQS